QLPEGVLDLGLDQPRRGEVGEEAGAAALEDVENLGGGGAERARFVAGPSRRGQEPRRVLAAEEGNGRVARRVHAAFCVAVAILGRGRGVEAGPADLAGETELVEEFSGVVLDARGQQRMLPGGGGGF